MLSKVDLRDFFEINQGLYEPVSAAHLLLAQALGLATDTRAAAQTCDAHPHEHTTKR
jgi:hypothetical protein